MANTLTIRLNQELRERLDKAVAAQTYPPSVTAVVERGIVLAIEEMDRIRAAFELEGRR